ncbi:saccharopine dehydrogenase-like oxidoreductase [Anarhichas minor]|uniref:saccharopine dehydrogenase-like oxidoreductase n=1 Tax=Anarhichas minor TaxID=65739 RepID=UPI003F73AEE7
MPELRTDVEIIVADVSVEESLAIMCQQGVVILNCVGPYRFYGQPVVKACIANGAHYIDICGEPQFLERMQLEHHTKALDRGVDVIGSCGFDSVPADLGVLYTQKQFKGKNRRLSQPLRTIEPFPSLFSFGLFTKSGPTLEQIEDTCFSVTLFGEGCSEGSDPTQGRPNAKICTQVIGAEPGYVATVSALVQAAVTLLNELHSLPRRGGVYTPGAASHKTSLLDRLHKHSIKFSVRNYQ